MLIKKEEKSADTFWREYEEKTGEKVIKRGLGKYISGWDEFDEKKWGGIWGLIIETSGGWRFHHFPQNSWIDLLTRFADSGQPKEKTIFLPQEKITSAQIIKETKRWKKLFTNTAPLLSIKYTDEAGNEKRLLFEVQREIS
ncbi:MAG: hypothetical protein FWC06_08050 [Treponema sp.]|nr:hypothetical protein [Treponema sp.]